MMSLTSVCAPKPIATPKMPAPAMSGPISTPRPDRTVSTATTPMKTASALRKIGSSVRSRPPLGHFLRGVSLLARQVEPVLDVDLGQLPQQVGDQQDDDAVEHALHEALEGRAAAHRVDAQMPDIGEPGDRKSDDRGPRAAHDDHVDQPGVEADGLVAAGNARGRAPDTAHRLRQRQDVDADPEQPGEAADPDQPQHDQRDRQDPAADRRCRSPGRTAGSRPCGARPRGCRVRADMRKGCAPRGETPSTGSRLTSA